MAVVRELVTRLSFALDRSNLDRFERNIVGFKTRMSLAAGVVAASISKVFNAIDSLAQTSYKVKDIATLAGLSTEEFVAMRQAAKDLGVSFDSIDSAFIQISRDILEAKNGYGKFIELVRQSSGAVRLPNFAEQGENIKQALGDIFDYIDSFNSRQTKLFVLQNYFGEKQGSELLRLIEQGKDKFLEAAAANREFAASFTASEEPLRRFEQNLSQLSSSVDKLYFNLASRIVPVLSEVTEGINEVFAREKDFGGGFEGLLKSAFNATGQSLDYIFGKLIPEYESLNKIQERIANENIAFYNSLAPNTTVNVTVPPGTTEEQAGYTADMVKEAVKEANDETIRQIVSSNPMVE